MGRDSTVIATAPLAITCGRMGTHPITLERKGAVAIGSRNSREYDVFIIKPPPSG